jgi:hypothetical protein
MNIKGPALFDANYCMQVTYDITQSDIMLYVG